MKKYLFTLFSVSIFATFSFASNQQRVDSLLKILPTVKTDTGKITVLLDIANAYRHLEVKKATKYIDEAFHLSKKINKEEKLYKCYIVKGLINYRIGNNKEAITNFLQVINNVKNPNNTKGKAYIDIGNVYADLGKYDSSIYYYNKGVVVFDKIGNAKYKANVLNNIGTIYNELGDFDKAIDYYTKAQKTHEKYGNEMGKAASTENIGVIYYYQKNYAKAIEYFSSALKIFKQQKRLDKEANTMGNIASINILLGNSKKGLSLFNEIKDIYVKMGDKSGEALTLQNMSNIYFKNKQPNKGLASIKKALKIYKEIGLTRSIGKCYASLGGYYFENKSYEKSISNYLITEKIFQPLGVKNDLRELYQKIARTYAKLNNFKKSSSYLEKYIILNDSIFNSEKNKQITAMQEKYDSEKKQKEIALLNKEKELKNTELIYQKQQKLGFGVGLVLALILLFLVFKGYTQKKKVNAIITQQKNIVEEKNKEIIDSINYAKRIQNALLKSEQQESPHLPKHFVLFNPKDIVSGDFYWAIEKQNYFYLAVGDCTGHGVPGAFLTMLGISFLNEITAKIENLLPSVILDKLRDKIITELNQSGNENENKDGMDISLIRLNLKTNELDWAGANNPLWLIKNKETNSIPSLQIYTSSGEINLYEIKADKQPISYYPNQKPFTNHHTKLYKDDCIYLFTDGFADQFGGIKGKKFKYKPFKELLISICIKT